MTRHTIPSLSPYHRLLLAVSNLRGGKSGRAQPSPELWLLEAIVDECLQAEDEEAGRVFR